MNELDLFEEDCFEDLLREDTTGGIIDPGPDPSWYPGRFPDDDDDDDNEKKEAPRPAPTKPESQPGKSGSGPSKG